MRQDILTGPERRRRWSSEQKVAIVLEASRGEQSVASVARRHDISRQHIYQWRSAMRKGALARSDAAGFLEVHLDTCDPAVTTNGLSFCDTLTVDGDLPVEIVVRNGRAIRVGDNALLKGIAPSAT